MDMRWEYPLLPVMRISELQAREKDKRASDVMILTLPYSASLSRKLVKPWVFSRSASGTADAEVAPSTYSSMHNLQDILAAPPAVLLCCPVVIELFPGDRPRS
jgi:hypothetical protein